MFINPGTIFVPLTPCSQQQIVALHDINTAPDNTAFTQWCDQQHNIDYIADLGTCIGAKIPRDIDFEFAVELFTRYLHDGDARTPAAASRYRIATQSVMHPTFGPGMVIIGASHISDVTTFITDIMRYGEVTDPDTANAHMPVLHAGCVFDTTKGGVVVAENTGTAWCEIFDATTAPAATPNSTKNPDNNPNNTVTMAKYPTGTVITVHTIPGDEAQYSPVAQFDVTVAVESWLNHRHDEAASVPSGSNTANAANRHSDSIDLSPNTSEINAEAVTIPDHTVAGYTMEQAKPFDDLLGTILRSVAAQIEQHGVTHLNEAARADRDATLATLTAAATMVENQAQHVDAVITDTVIDNLATLARRIEAHSAALDEDDLTHNDSAPTDEQLEIPLDAVIDDSAAVDPRGALSEDADPYSDDEIGGAALTNTAPQTLNPAEATLTEVATLAQVRIKQFINRAEF